jgi:hypothetical protein
MHQHLADVLRMLDASRAGLRTAVEAIPAPLRQQRPAPGRWSAAEIVEHLGLVDLRFASLVGAAIDRALEAGVGRETGPREPIPDAVAARLADRTEKRTSPESAVPTGALNAAAAWASAEEARRRLRDTVLRGDGLALSTVCARHGFFGELTIYQWVELVARHERRHTAQIDELRSQLAATP